MQVTPGRVLECPLHTIVVFASCRDWVAGVDFHPSGTSLASGSGELAALHILCMMARRSLIAYFQQPPSALLQLKQQCHCSATELALPSC